MTAPNQGSASESAHFQFLGLNFHKLVFEELSSDHEIRPVGPDETRQVNLQAQVTIGISPESEARVILQLIVTPDATVQPYRIEVVASGLFRGVGDVSQEQMTAFAQNNAPTIMMPYAREAIQRLTSDARFGPVRLNPMNIQAMLPKEKWTPAGEASGK